jgi:hypothetical protein
MHTVRRKDMWTVHARNASMDFSKALAAGQIVISYLIEDPELQVFIEEAEKSFNWTLTNAFQFATGKRFLAVYERVSNENMRVGLLLANAVAKYKCKEDGLLDFQRPFDGLDVARFRAEAEVLLNKNADATA